MLRPPERAIASDTHSERYAKRAVVCSEQAVRDGAARLVVPFVQSEDESRGVNMSCGKTARCGRTCGRSGEVLLLVGRWRGVARVVRPLVRWRGAAAAWRVAYGREAVRA